VDKWINDDDDDDDDQFSFPFGKERTLIFAQGYAYLAYVFGHCV